MTEFEQIQKTLESIISMQYTQFAILLVLLGFCLALAYRLDVFQGLVKEKRIPQLYELAVRATKNTLRNLGGTNPVPDIPEQLMQDFFTKWLDRYNKTGEMDFTEGKCLPMWGGSQVMYRKFMDWCAVEMIVRRKVEGATKGPNSAWIAADTRGTVKRIERHLSPANDRNTPKLLQ